jgi:hypothetical protein
MSKRSKTIVDFGKDSGVRVDKEIFNEKRVSYLLQYYPIFLGKEIISVREHDPIRMKARLVVLKRCGYIVPVKAIKRLMIEDMEK